MRPPTPMLRSPMRDHHTLTYVFPTQQAAVAFRDWAAQSSEEQSSQSEPQASAGNPATDTLDPGSPLDEAWAAVNVLGAPDTACRTDEDRAYCRGIGDALEAIEKLGGRPW